MDVNPECAPLNDCHVVCLSSLEYTRPPSSKHRGVSWDKAKSKWKARISRNGVPKILGRFAEEEEAAAAYRAAEAAIARGEEPVSAGPARRPPSSKHRGVSWDKATGKWMAQIKLNGVNNKNLGRFAEA